MFAYVWLCQDSGRVRIVKGVLVIDEIVPSDGGLYSCMAVSTSGNASRDVAIYSRISYFSAHYKIRWWVNWWKNDFDFNIH